MLSGPSPIHGRNALTRIASSAADRQPSAVIMTIAAASIASGQRSGASRCPAITVIVWWTR
ncbi:hypothetical protein [Roseateles chitinivorans]|uniref:hypothetical protein n=1 Tax=Roseateles chitinivorans TaxID=2917965 RepID=UPI003D67E09F